MNQSSTDVAASEERYRAILRTAMDGFWLTDASGRLLEVNESYSRMSGYSIDELLQMRASDIDVVESLEDVTARTRRIEASGEDRFETRHRRKDGTLLDVEINVQFQPVEGGRFVCFLRDITERKRLEEMAHKNVMRLELALNSANAAIWDWDVASGAIEWSKGMFDLFGLDASTSTASFDTWRAVVHPEDIAAAELRIADALQRRALLYSDYRVVLPDGQVRWVSAPGRGIYDAAGQPVRMIGICIDVTARKQADLALAESEHTLRSIFATMTEGVALNEIVTDDHGEMVDYRIVAVNDAFYRIADFSGGPVVGRLASDLYGLPREYIRDFWVRHRDQTTVQQTDLPSPSHPDRWYHVSTSPFVGGRFVTTFSDITARKQAEAEKERLEAQLHHAQKLESVGRLAGGVAHDFNNMLGVILGNVELALQETDPSQSIHADLVEIQHAARRSAAFTKQLLAYARKQTVAPEVLDLNKAVSALLSMLQRLIGEDIQLRWEPSAELWPVTIDPSQLANVLTNLCVNARHAITGVGTIEMGTANCTLDAAYCALHADAMPGEYVRLSVRDTGVGMDGLTLEHLFEPFFTTKGVGEGTGLGLAAVYGAVRQNGGFVTVASVLGEGATFELFFPRSPSAASATLFTELAAVDTRGSETILLVEDEPGVLLLTARVLRQQGYAVLVAKGPADALRIAAEYDAPIHLLLSDVVMPEMSGPDMAKALVPVRPRLRQLFMSGHPADTIANRGILDATVSFLEKPYTLAGLLAKVREVLDQ